MKKGKSLGFTMIELIVVIIILGILASYAVPKFMGIDKAAREAVVKGLHGATKSASEMVHAIAITQGKAANLELDKLKIGEADGEEVDIIKGYAAASSTGIGAALDVGIVSEQNAKGDFVIVAEGTDPSEFALAPSTARNPTKCKVKYKYSNTGSSVRPEISIDLEDCS